jgi:hypothetical protein
MVSLLKPRQSHTYIRVGVPSSIEDDGEVSMRRWQRTAEQFARLHDKARRMEDGGIPSIGEDNGEVSTRREQHGGVDEEATTDV